MRIALVPINPTVGNLEINTDLIRTAIADATRVEADLLVLPELCVSGYPPRDLLLHNAFIAACTDAAARIAETVPKDLTVILGAPLSTDAPRAGITNSLLACSDGRITARYDKRLLPTYDVFDEDRYFVPGQKPIVIKVKGVGVGLSVCEDLWRGVDARTDQRYAASPDPVAELVKKGARIIVNPSASPFVLGKREEHQRILAAHARAHSVTIASVNQLGGNDELVFDGAAMVATPEGHVLGLNAPFSVGTAVFETTSTKPEPASIRPEPRELFDALTLGVRDYVRKTGFDRALIGLSGGIDSAVTAAVAVVALGQHNVRGVAMPGPYSSEHSVTDALDLAERLGIECLTVPIAQPYEGFTGVTNDAFDAIGELPLGATSPDIARENLQSRVRGTVMMTLSNRTGDLVLTTGNKSELAVGYCTLYGDMNGGLAVLSDLGKMQVYALAQHMNEHPEDLGFEKTPIPERTITKPPSAELAPDQQDADSLPPYEMLDEIVCRYVDRREPAKRIAARTQFDPETVNRICRLIDRNEYKRKQAAIGLKVSSVAFGTGRRMPIAQGWDGTLEGVDAGY